MCARCKPHPSCSHGPVGCSSGHPFPPVGHPFHQQLGKPLALPQHMGCWKHPHVPAHASSSCTCLQQHVVQISTRTVFGHSCCSSALADPRLPWLYMPWRVKHECLSTRPGHDLNKDLNVILTKSALTSPQMGAAGPTGWLPGSECPLPGRRRGGQFPCTHRAHHPAGCTGGRHPPPDPHTRTSPTCLPHAPAIPPGCARRCAADIQPVRCLLLPLVEARNMKQTRACCLSLLLECCMQYELQELM